MLPAILAFLKNKSIIFGAILALLVIGGGVWFSNKIPGPKTENTAKATAILPTKISADSPDSDSDGLKDWEEQLWGTNPKNPDTDADGIPDGKEIQDNLSKKPEAKIPDQTTAEPLTLTDQLARDFLQTYLQQKGSAGGSALDEQDQQSILNSLLYNLPSPETKNIYASKDILVLTSDDKEIRLSYLREVAKVIMQSMDIKGNELVILRDALEREDAEELARLNPIAATYESMVKDLLKIKAPKNYVRLHLGLINSINNLAKSITLMQDFFKDPLKGITAASFFNSEGDRLGAVLAGFQEEAKKDNIIFIAIRDE